MFVAEVADPASPVHAVHLFPVQTAAAVMVPAGGVVALALQSTATDVVAQVFPLHSPVDVAHS